MLMCKFKIVYPTSPPVRTAPIPQFPADPALELQGPKVSETPAAPPTTTTRRRRRKGSAAAAVAAASGAKLLGCQLCQKKYTDRATLRRHLKSHTDYLPYRCPPLGAGAVRKLIPIPTRFRITYRMFR